MPLTWQILAQASQPPISVWWPTDDAHVSGIQPFKALVNDRDITQYRMSWSVDGGQQNTMLATRQDGPHFESEVNLESWNWRGEGAYTVTFRATDNQGQVIAERTVRLYVTKGTTMARPSATLAPAPTLTPEPTPIHIPQPTLKPITKTFYVNPANPALQTAANWASTRPAEAAVMRRIGATPTAQWFGDWNNNNLTADVNALVTAADRAGQVPILVAYNIPQRDCGSYSAGGSAVTGYASWIKSMADGISSRPAVVILEPDALAHISCLSSADQATRLNLLAQAVDTLKSHSQTRVYLDAGHARWIDASTMATSLRQANVAKADGFSLNISNFMTTADNTTYGHDISARLGGKHFIIDTSRNGLGPASDSQWCNPSGRGLGTLPTSVTNDPLIDAYVWAKVPGESDGSCNGGPAAGTWWPDYALSLARNVAF